MHSAFLSLIKIKYQLPGPLHSILDVFRNEDKVGRIGQLGAKTLYLHGTHDRLIPADHTVALHSNTPNAEPAIYLQGHDHNDQFDLKLLEPFIRDAEARSEKTGETSTDVRAELRPVVVGFCSPI